MQQRQSRRQPVQRSFRTSGTWAKGVAIRDAFQKAKELDADILVCLDAGGQHNPDEIPDFLVPIQDGTADMVIGSRFLDKKSAIPRYRRAGQEDLTALRKIPLRAVNGIKMELPYGVPPSPVPAQGTSMEIGWGVL